MSDSMVRVLGLDLGKTWGWAQATVPEFQADNPRTRVLWRWGEEELSVVGRRTATEGVIYHEFASWVRPFIEQQPPPDLIVYEDVNFSRGKSYIPGMKALLVEHVEKLRGEGREVEMVGLPIGTLKKLATGNGRASKPEVMSAVKKRFQKKHGLASATKWDDRRKLTDNMADAIWAARYGLGVLGVLRNT